MTHKSPLDSYEHLLSELVPLVDTVGDSRPKNN